MLKMNSCIYIGEKFSRKKNQRVPSLVWNSRKWLRETCHSNVKVIFGFSYKLSAFLGIQSILVF